MTKETVNLKTDKQKLYNLNNRERDKGNKEQIELQGPMGQNKQSNICVTDVSEGEENSAGLKNIQRNSSKFCKFVERYKLTDLRNSVNPQTG